MILDTTSKTVFFSSGTTLTLAQLKGLVDLLDTGLVPVVDPEAGRHNITVNFIFRASSDVSSKTYVVVRYDTSEWACSCPDWTHRRSKSGEICKHILRLQAIYGK